MKIREAKLLISAVSEQQFPEGNLPEIAFVGRSNVGKSSLINMILGRRSFARTSQTPGKTRTINFYEINQQLRLVDLPGYGYAKVSKAEKAKWAGFIERYIEGREELLRVVLLLDARHEPTQDDKAMIQYLRHQGRPFLVALTKIDKVKQADLAKRRQLLRQVGLPEEDVIATSATSKKGKYVFWDRLNEIFAEEGIAIVMERQQ